MTHNFNEVKVKTQQSLETIDFTQFGELVLSQLGIKSATSLLADSSPWEFAHYMAIKNWLMYKPKLNASNLEQVKHYLKVFHHLCEVEAWETACKLIRLNIPNTKELHEQLGIWGYYNEQIEIYSRLLTKLNLDLDCLWLDGIGTAYSYLGKAQIAIDYHERQLEIAREINNRKAEAQAHGGLGWVYGYCLEKAEEALTHYQEQLKISREIGDQQLKAMALATLANSYWHQGYIWGHTWGLLLIIRSMLIFPPWKNLNTKLILKITIRTISKTLKQVFSQNWLKQFRK